MNIMMGIGERNFQNSAKSLMSDYVRIIGRVIGKVLIKDINKTIAYNTVLDIPANEAQQSKDLLNAISNKWVDVVYGKEFIQQKAYNSEKMPVQVNENKIQQNQVQQNQVQQIDIDDLKNYVTTETQRVTASLNETVAQVLNEVKKLQGTQSQNQSPVDINLADVIAKQILQNLPTANTKVTKVEDKAAESVFIDIDEKRELKSNIKVGELGNLTTVKDKKAKSIASKLKNMNKEGV